MNKIHISNARNILYKGMQAFRVWYNGKIVWQRQDQDSPISLTKDILYLIPENNYTDNTKIITPAKWTFKQIKSWQKEV